MMKKNIEVYEDIEEKGSYLVYGSKNMADAVKALSLEYSESVGKINIEQSKYVASYKCLDCESYWTSDDVCGECGEYRLSKRAKWCWYFQKNY